MNKFIILGILFLGLIPLIDNSFQTEIQNDVFIFVQTSIKNSDGQLVAYLESSKFSHLNLPALNSFLDFEASQRSSPIITIDGKQHEIIRRVQSQSFDYEGLVASTILYDRIEEKSILLARFSHDGYQVIPGDVLESMWTFIRPVS